MSVSRKRKVDCQPALYLQHAFERTELYPMPADVLALRNLAADCYILSDKSPAQAAKLFKTKVKGSSSVSCQAKFCKKWGEHRLQYNNVCDRPRSGRPPKLGSQQVTQCINALIKNRVVGTKKEPYRSWRQFTRSNPVAQKILQESQVTAGQLRRRCKAERPSLVRRKVYRKPHLDEEHRADRIAACKQLLRQPDYMFNATCYTDHKKFYINPVAKYAWIDSETYEGPLIVEDKRLLSNKDYSIKINYSITVNPLAGPVNFTPLTGTTGYKGDRVDPPFLVSHTSRMP